MDRLSDGTRLLASAQSVAGLAMIVAAAALFGGETTHSALPVLMPALGALLVIGAGASGGVNRVLLGNPAMVLLGKVSYPLYLWHWPALSFLTIVESGTEPWTWRLGAVGASLVLAWLTWRFLELPVRRLPKARAVAPLLALSITTGVVGGLVHVEGGFPHRMRDLDSQFEAFEWESMGLFERDDCSASLGVPGRCLSNGRPHSVAVVGDSFSTNMFLILQELHRDDGVGVMRLGRAGCLPFFGVERYLGSASQQCRDAMNRNLEHVLQDQAITTVVLSLRESLYLGRAGGNRLELAGEVNPRPPFEVFRSALEQTVARYSAAGKHVIYAFGWPELSFDPKACVDVRPLRLRSYEQGACTMDRRDVEARSAGYRRMVLDVLARFPRTSYWDPYRVLCDDLACYSKRNGVMLYRDGHHLSLPGCEYLGSRFTLEPVAGDDR
ncbi:MAG: acyltransferase family protein [Candidatus Binatia bacterium]